MLEDASLSAEKRAKAVAANDRRDLEQSRQLLLDKYPNIPQHALQEILDHGFEKGSGRVGRTSTLSDSVKAELAVHAHIRHRCTDYDSNYARSRGPNGQDGPSLKTRQRARVYDQVRKIANSWARPTLQTVELDGSANRKWTSLEGLLGDVDESEKDEGRLRSSSHLAHETTLEGALSGMNLNGPNETIFIENIKARHAKKQQSRKSRRMAEERALMPQQPSADGSHSDQAVEIITPTSLPLGSHVSANAAIQSENMDTRESMTANSAVASSTQKTDTTIYNIRNPHPDYIARGSGRGIRPNGEKTKSMILLEKMNNDPNLKLADARLVKVMRLNFILGGTAESLGPEAAAQYRAYMKSGAKKTVKPSMARLERQARSGNSAISNVTKPLSKKALKQQAKMIRRDIREAKVQRRRGHPVNKVLTNAHTEPLPKFQFHTLDEYFKPESRDLDNDDDMDFDNLP